PTLFRSRRGQERRQVSIPTKWSLHCPQLCGCSRSRDNFGRAGEVCQGFHPCDSVSGALSRPEGENRRHGKNQQWYSGPRRGKIAENACYFKAFGGLLVGSTRSKPVLSNRVLSEEEKEEMKEMKGIKMKKDEKRRFVECGASVRMRSLV